MSRRYQDPPPPLTLRTTGEIIAEQQAELRKQWEEEEAERGKPKPVRIFSTDFYKVYLVFLIVMLAFNFLYAYTINMIVTMISFAIAGGIIGLIAGSLTFTDREPTSHQRLYKLKMGLLVACAIILFLGDIVIGAIQKYPVEDPYILISVFTFILALWIGLFTEVLLVHRFHPHNLSSPASSAAEA